MPHEDQITREMRDCIQMCMNCHAICLESVQHCMMMGGKHADPNHIRMLLDCAEICQTSANFMLRGSENHVHTCAACAELCRQCADDCDRLASDDELMARCAETCRRCARMCADMAHAAV